MAPEFRVEHPLLVLHRGVAMIATPFGDCREAPPQALLHRAHVHCEFPIPASCTPVRKAQEIEGSGLRLQPFCLMMSVTPELHQASLLRMKPQPVLRKPVGGEL